MNQEPFDTGWASGVAEVVSHDAMSVWVSCPHCGKEHRHGKTMVGSNAIASGCHAGYSRCRQYRVVDLGRR